MPHFTQFTRRRIQGALRNLGCHISDSTVANVLKAQGIEPVPDGQRTPCRRYVEHEHAERNHQGLGNEPSSLIRMLVLLLAESSAENASVER